MQINTIRKTIYNKRNVYKYTTSYTRITQVTTIQSTNIIPYNDCHYCGMLFKIHSKLKRHVRIHNNAKPYSCRHCSDGFMRLEQLKTHLLKSHNEGTWFTCDICQMKLTTKWNLEVHVQRHAAVKPYVCSECPKRFCTAPELRRHHPVHSA